MPSVSPQEYSPFPSFAVWNADEMDFPDVAAAAARFMTLRNKVSQDALDRALETARRTAAVDTNAIEGIFATDRGFTRTVAEKTGAWEQAMADKGPHVRPAFEDTLAGFELILDRMTGRQPVTASFIRELHETMLQSQDTHTVYVPVDGELVPQQQQLAKGEYKRHANSPTRSDGTVHAYAPVEDTAPEMSRLIDELRSAGFEEAPSITQAAYAHYAFVCIHPFADGNGRVARALASVYLYRSPGVPLVIYQDQRTSYLDALEAGDRGQFHPLMRFVAERVIDTVNLIEADLTRPNQYSSADELALLLQSGSTSDVAVDAASRLKEVVREALRTRIDEQAEKLGLPFKTSRSLVGQTPPVPDHYDSINDEMATGLYISVQTPKKILVTWPVALCARASDDADFDIVAVTGTGRRLGGYLRELRPTVSESLRQRVGLFADAVVEEFLGLVAEAARKAGQPR